MSEPKASVSERLRIVKSRLSYMTPNYDKHAAELEALATEIEAERKVLDAIATVLHPDMARQTKTEIARLLKVMSGRVSEVADALAPRKEGT